MKQIKKIKKQDTNNRLEDTFKCYFFLAMPFLSSSQVFQILRHLLVLCRLTVSTIYL